MGALKRAVISHWPSGQESLSRPHWPVWPDWPDWQGHFLCGKHWPALMLCGQDWPETGAIAGAEGDWKMGLFLPHGPDGPDILSLWGNFSAGGPDGQV